MAASPDWRQATGSYGGKRVRKVAIVQGALRVGDTVFYGRDKGVIDFISENGREAVVLFEHPVENKYNSLRVAAKELIHAAAHVPKINREADSVQETVPKQPKKGRPRAVTPETELEIAIAHHNGNGSERELAEQFGVKKGVIEQAIKRADLPNLTALSLFEGELTGALQSVSAAETALVIAESRLLGIRERMAEQGFALIRESHFDPSPIRTLLQPIAVDLLDLEQMYREDGEEMIAVALNYRGFFRGIHMLEELLGCKLWEGDTQATLEGFSKNPLEAIDAS